jgi:nitrogen fixation/metabolism regulation signal transduction histidine kinase
VTEDLPADRYEREPSSALLEISRLREGYVSLKERHNALKSDVSDMRSSLGDLKEILLTHVENAGERHSQLLAAFNQHRLESAVLSQKVLQIDAHLTATDTRLEDSTKRDPVTFWTSMAAAGTAVGAIAAAIFGGKP